MMLAQADAPAAPGEVKVDREAAERALERSLVRTGALLLPFGKAEIEPAFSYIRVERSTPVLFSQAGQQFLGQETVSTDIAEASLLLRIGLPADAQLELGLPYRYVDEERVTEVGFATSAASSAHRSGVGDLRVGLAKGLLAERGARPNLVGRVTWDTDTGKTDGDEPVSLGGFGFNEIEASLSATKRQDPLVFVGDLFYRTSLDEGEVRPGDQFGLSLGTLLAASPDTSLRVVLDQAYVRAYELNGIAVSGSDSTIATLLFGASSIVGIGKFLDFSVQAGLTEAAPAYALNLAFAVRFGVPGVR